MMSHPPIDQRYLAELLLTHLNREELSLRTIRTTLGELHNALIKNDLDALDQGRSKQTEVVEDCSRLQESRMEICRVLGHALSIRPEEITLSLIASQLPSPWNEKITHAKQRLQVLASEIDLLSKRNAALIGYCRSYMQRILDCLTAVGTPVVRYGPSGEQTESSRSSVLVAQG